MSQKNVKRLRKMVRDTRTSLIKDFLKGVHTWPYWSRIKIALQILKKQKNLKSPNIKEKKTDFKINDLVRTGIIPEERHIVRKITHITPFDQTPSKFLISVDGGEFCKHCRMRGHSIQFMDASLFVRIKIKSPEVKERRKMKFMKDIYKCEKCGYEMSIGHDTGASQEEIKCKQCKAIIKREE